MNRTLRMSHVASPDPKEVPIKIIIEWTLFDLENALYQIKNKTLSCYEASTFLMALGTLQDSLAKNYLLELKTQGVNLVEREGT